MGYYLQALIGKTDSLKSDPKSCPSEHRVELAQGYTMILVTDEFCEEIAVKFSANEEESASGFSMLTENLAAWAKQISKLTPVAYIEAEYFGGAGEQSAIVWDKSEIKLGPISAEIGPINQALSFLGAKVLSANDEFEAVGLNRGRDSEDWIEISKNLK
jgi:hypothetical protein